MYIYGMAYRKVELIYTEIQRAQLGTGVKVFMLLGEKIKLWVM
jgi:hypothetical protein